MNRAYLYATLLWVFFGAFFTAYELDVLVILLISVSSLLILLSFVSCVFFDIFRFNRIFWVRVVADFFILSLFPIVFFVIFGLSALLFYFLLFDSAPLIFRLIWPFFSFFIFYSLTFCVWFFKNKAFVFNVSNVNKVSFFADSLSLYLFVIYISSLNYLIFFYFPLKYLGLFLFLQLFFMQGIKNFYQNAWKSQIKTMGIFGLYFRLANVVPLLLAFNLILPITDLWTFVLCNLVFICPKFDLDLPHGSIRFVISEHTYHALDLKISHVTFSDIFSKIDLFLDNFLNVTSPTPENFPLIIVEDGFVAQDDSPSNLIHAFYNRIFKPTAINRGPIVLPRPKPKLPINDTVRASLTNNAPLYGRCIDEINQATGGWFKLPRTLDGSHQAVHLMSHIQNTVIEDTDAIAGVTSKIIPSENVTFIDQYEPSNADITLFMQKYQNVIFIKSKDTSYWSVYNGDITYKLNQKQSAMIDRHFYSKKRLIRTASPMLLDGIDCYRMNVGDLFSYDTSKRVITTQTECKSVSNSKNVPKMQEQLNTHYEGLDSQLLDVTNAEMHIKAANSSHIEVHDVSKPFNEEHIDKVLRTSSKLWRKNPDIINEIKSELVMNRVRKLSDLE